MGPGGDVLLLARRDQRRDGQLRVRAGALQAGGERVVRRVPGGRRGHPQERHGGRDRLALGDLSAISRRRRLVPQGHQLRRLYRALGSQDVRDGGARPGPGGRRGRSRVHGGPGAGGAPRRRRGPLFVEGHHPHPPGRRPGGEPHRQLGGDRALGARDGRAERRYLPGRARRLRRRRAGRMPGRAGEDRGLEPPAADAGGAFEPPGRQSPSPRVPVRVDGQGRGRRGAGAGASHHAVDQRHVLVEVLPALRCPAGLERYSRPPGGAAAGPLPRPGYPRQPGRGRSGG